MLTTRFAPSPTGFLHIGGLRTALFNWLYAKKTGGKFLLRIEDTDANRNQEDALQAILEAFKWVGLKNDGDVWYQSKRQDIYKRYIEKLLKEGKAYYCYMSQEELEASREKQKANGQTPRYDGRYRDGKLPPKDGVEPVVRIKAPLDGEVIINDGVKGKVVFNWKDATDDFIIARSDGSPTYNFVVTIDDALSGVSDVIRGDDHLSNTPKQIVIYEALGFKVPNFFHVPMIHNEQGKKLSKRRDAVDVMEYQKMGYLPHALLNFLVRLGWSNKDQEIFSLEEMINLFDPHDINKSASCYNIQKLDWLNAHYIKTSKNQDLIKSLQDFGVDLSKHKKKDELLNFTKQKAKNLLALKTQIEKFLNSPQSYNEEDLSKIKKESIKILDSFCQKIEKNAPKEVQDYAKIIEDFLVEQNIKMPELCKPLRFAIFGEARGASLPETLKILGIEEIKNRVGLLEKVLK